MAETTLIITVRPRLRLRLRVAIWLVRLAAWVAGVRSRVDVDANVGV